MNISEIGVIYKGDIRIVRAWERDILYNDVYYYTTVRNSADDAVFVVIDGDNGIRTYDCDKVRFETRPSIVKYAAIIIPDEGLYPVVGTITYSSLEDSGNKTVAEVFQAGDGQFITTNGEIIDEYLVDNFDIANLATDTGIESVQTNICCAVVTHDGRGNGEAGFIGGYYIKYLSAKEDGKTNDTYIMYFNTFRTGEQVGLRVALHADFNYKLANISTDSIKEKTYHQWVIIGMCNGMITAINEINEAIQLPAILFCKRRFSLSELLNMQNKNSLDLRVGTIVRNNENQNLYIITGRYGLMYPESYIAEKIGSGSYVEQADLKKMCDEWRASFTPDRSASGFLISEKSYDIETQYSYHVSFVGFYDIDAEFFRYHPAHGFDGVVNTSENYNVGDEVFINNRQALIQRYGTDNNGDPNTLVEYTPEIERMSSGFGADAHVDPDPVYITAILEDRYLVCGNGSDEAVMVSADMIVGSNYYLANSKDSTRHDTDNQFKNTIDMDINMPLSDYIVRNDVSFVVSLLKLDDYTTRLIRVTVFQLSDGQLFVEEDNEIDSYWLCKDTSVAKFVDWLETHYGSRVMCVNNSYITAYLYNPCDFSERNDIYLYGKNVASTNS